MADNEFTTLYTDKAKPFLSSVLATKVRNLNIAPTWIGGEDRFWFKDEGKDGHRFVTVDAATGEQTPSFDHEAVAASLRALGQEEAKAEKLDIVLEALKPDGTMRFQFGGKSYDAASNGDVSEGEARSPAQILSPDESKRVSIKDHNIQLEILATGETRMLTEDGAEYFDYGERNIPDLQMVNRRRLKLDKAIPLTWSPDGRYLLAPRTDTRNIPLRPYTVEHAPPDQHFSIAHMARHKMPFEDYEERQTLAIIDTETGASVEAKVESALLQGFAALWLRGGQVWWSLATGTVFIATCTLDSRRFGMLAVNLKDGSTRQVFEESHPLYMEHGPHDYHPPNYHVTADGSELIWYSNRSGFGHLYLYDVATGALKNPITSGEWDVADLVRVDEKGRQIYFAAGGIGSDENPYHAKLYRIGFDGGEIAELTPEDSNHLFGGMRFGIVSTARSQISPSGKSFVDVHTTLDQPPIMLLRTIDGDLIGEVARADASELYAMGWTPPERFVVKAADGETDLWGVYYKPRDFDPARKYAVIDHMYPGPQAAFGPHTFLTGTHLATDSQALANLGFIVVNLDGRGSTYRGAEFRYAFANTEDVFGAADHKAAIENLAKEHPFVDASRVGVKGASYGGYGSTRATLLFPDFFDVNVSYVGPHNFRNIGSPVSNERFFWNSDDRAEVEAYYDLTSNTRLADRLTGKMFLIWGEIDENVPANNAYIMKQALLDADVDFDSLMVPNNPHHVSHPSVHRREFKYFYDHLGPPQ